MVYLPDGSSKSQGVLRLPFNPATETVGPATVLAAGQGLGGNRPLASALGPDGSLYVSFQRNGSIVRVTTPTGPRQTVQAVGGSSDGRRVLSLSFAGSDLYLAETTAVTKMADAVSSACAGGCKAASAGVAVTAPLSVLSDGTYLYIGGAAAVSRYGLATGLLDLYVSGGAGGALQNVSGLGFDSHGSLFIGDDPANGAPALQGRIFTAVSPPAP